MSLFSESVLNSNLTDYQIVSLIHEEFISLYYKDVYANLYQFDDITTYPNGMIASDPQKGKSPATIVLQHRDQLRGIVPIHLCVKDPDIDVYKKSVVDYNVEFVSFLENVLLTYPSLVSERGVRPPFTYEFKYMPMSDIRVVGGEIELSVPFLSNLQPTSNSNQSYTVLTLNHPTQLTRLCVAISSLGNQPRRRCRAYVDEAHKSMFSSITTDLSVEELYASLDASDLPKGDALKVLFSLMSGMIVIGATPVRNLFDERTNITYVIVVCPKPPKCSMRHYAIQDMTHVSIDKLPPKTPCDEDQNLRRVLAEYSQLPLLDKHVYNLQEDMTEFMSIQVSSERRNHMKIYQMIVDEYSNQITPMVYNTDGFTLHITASDVPALYTAYGKKKVQVLSGLNDGKTYRAKSQILNEDGSIEIKFGTGVPLHCCLCVPAEIKSLRPILIGGNKLAEGQRVSDTNYKLILTREFLRPSKNSTVDKIIQALRIQGYKEASLQPVVYCEKEVFDNALRTQLLTQETLDKLEEEFAVNRTGTKIVNAIETLNSTRISKLKLPSKKMCPELTRTMKKNGVAMVQIIRANSDDLKLKATDYKVLTTDDIDTESNIDSEDDRPEYLKAMKRAYSTQKGILYVLIQEFIRREFESMSWQDITAHLGRPFISTHFTKWDMGTRKYYKVLDKTPSDEYILRPIIADYLNLL